MILRYEILTEIFRMNSYSKIYFEAVKRPLKCEIKGIGEIISHSTSHKSYKITEKCKERRLILLSEFKKLRDLIN